MGNRNDYEEINNSVQEENIYSKYDERSLYDTTVCNIKKGTNYTYIYCNPDYGFPFYINNNHPNYIQLYNMLKIDHSYTFVRAKALIGYADCIIDILPARTYTITSIVKGYIYVKQELYIDYHELIIDDDSKRFLIYEVNNDLIGQLCLIEYHKSYKTNFYKVINCKKL